MWKLSVRSTSKEPHEYVLKQGRYVLGRHSGNDIVIDDESASRHHAEIVCQEDAILIRDLDSLNGTFVNRKLLTEPFALSIGDQIRIGFHVIRISSNADSRNNSSNENVDLSDTQPITRDLLIESVDKSSILLHEFTSRRVRFSFGGNMWENRIICG
ncbi:MAG: FHA domain-containing protein, partial [Chloroflexi bacterium]|nr:FHA domain-containing protein [Chloroflexota bacterium]